MASLALAVIAASAGWASSGLAEGAIAVGMPENNPTKGFRHTQYVNEPDADSAASKAMEDCRAARNPRTGAACKLIGTFRDQCVAVAVNGDVANDEAAPVIAVGWAIAPDSETAASRAKAQCDEMRKGRRQACGIEGDILCDGRAK